MKTNGKLMITCVFICLIGLNIIGFGVKAQPTGAIEINPDGSVSGTNQIDRDGSIYHLSGNIYDKPITVFRNNVVIYGEGYALQGAGGWGTPGVPGLEKTAAINLICSNVTVQDFNISGWETGVAGTYNSNRVLDNNISRTEDAIAIYADNYVVSGNYLASSIYAVYIKGNNNLVSQNQIADNYGGVMMRPSLKTTITENTFSNNTIDLNVGTYEDFSYQIYDNNFIVGAKTTVVATSSDALGPVDEGTLPPLDNGSLGNYWSDYATKYPDAAEIGKSGIGDTPYLIRVDPTVIDRYPLMTPVSNQPATAKSAAATPTANQTSVSKAVLPSTAPSPNPTNSMVKTTLLAVLVIAAASCVIVLVFRNKLFWLRKGS